MTLDQTMTKFDQLNVRIEEMGRLIQTQAAEIDHLQKELALAEIRIEELAGEKEERDG